MLEKSEPQVYGRVKVYPLKGLLCGFVGDQREFRELGHLTISFCKIPRVHKSLLLLALKPRP